MNGLHLLLNCQALYTEVYNLSGNTSHRRVASETGLWSGLLPNHVLLNAYPPGSGIMVGLAAIMLDVQLSCTDVSLHMFHAVAASRWPAV